MVWRNYVTVTLCMYAHWDADSIGQFSKRRRQQSAKECEKRQQKAIFSLGLRQSTKYDRKSRSKIPDHADDAYSRCRTALKSNVSLQDAVFYVVKTDQRLSLMAQLYTRRSRLDRFLSTTTTTTTTDLIRVSAKSPVSVTQPLYRKRPPRGP